MSSPNSTTWSSNHFLGKYASILLPIAVALIYAGGHLTWYLGTPLGRVPVLDEQENVTLATAIFDGNLPAEPFYRAPGYALGLATLRWLGVSATGLFSTGLAAGVLLHAINAGIIARVAGKLFGECAAYLAGFIAALYPVFVHFSTQALDSVPSLTLFLLGISRLIPGRGAEVRVVDWIVASLFWGAATLVRPNFLAVWMTLPFMAVVTSVRRDRLPMLAGALAGGLLFAVSAVWQWRVSSVAGFLPWQGAYNLWAANQPEGHGRYYVQKTALPATLARQNPARVESILFYQQANPQTSADIPTMNTYWRDRFREEVVDQPFAWVGLLVRKTYAFCNDWEQYNNKTYAFHQLRSPWLRWNPLSWGLLFVLGLAGAARLATESKKTTFILGLVAITYSASVILFYVSDRFRLPMAALGIVLTSGALTAPGFWRSWPTGRQWLLAGGLLTATALTFSNFDSVRSRTTFVQDHALLARAADTVGDDQTAWHEARDALAMQPLHPDAMQIAIAAYFNQLLNGTAAPADEPAWLAVSRHFLTLSGNNNEASDLRVVAALALWRAGERDPAVAEWRNMPSNPSAIAARVLSGDSSVQPGALNNITPHDWRQPLVQLAAFERGLVLPQGAAIEGFEHPSQLAAKLFPGTNPR
jgi:hypothetical protein